MNKDEQDLIATIADTLHVPASELGFSNGPGDVESWDSLGHVRVIAALEQRYGITLDEDQLFEIETVGELVEAFLKAQPSPE